MCCDTGRGKLLTKLQIYSFLVAKVLDPLLVISGLHDDVIPPVCAYGPAPQVHVYIGVISGYTKSHEPHLPIQVCHVCTVILLRHHRGISVCQIEVLPVSLSLQPQESKRSS